MSYWDTSALLKLYVAEADSAPFLALADSTANLLTCVIAQAEVRTAFHWREAEGVLSLGGAALCYQRFLEDGRRGHLGLVPESFALHKEFGNILSECFCQIPPVLIRSNDAMHLAAARLVGETEFVSADLNQRAAARMLGFHVLP